MMERPVRSILLLILALAMAFPVCAKPIVIKLATITPKDSPWGTRLDKLAAAWKSQTNGDVELRVYHGGVAGGESDMIRKMKLNQIQGGVFTSIGLNAMNPDVLTLSVPLLIRNDGELSWVLEKTESYLDAGFDRKGFTIIAWSKAGWLRIFSKKPVVFPEDLMKLRLGVSPAELEMQQAFKTMGFSVVPVESSDALTALNSGMIEAVQSNTLGAASMQVFGIAKYLTDIEITPFLGGIVLNKAAWESIPDSYKPGLKSSIKELEDGLEADMPKLEARAMDVMTKNGLVVPPMSAEARSRWVAVMEEGSKKLIGTTFSTDMYSRIQDILKEYRNK
jgi:TRAP-type transport system periplasmic protein